MTDAPDTNGEFAAHFVVESARILDEVSADVAVLAGLDALARDNLDRLRSAAHSIAGSAAVLGLEAIAASARELERELAALRATGEPASEKTRRRLARSFRSIGRACCTVQAASRALPAVVTVEGAAPESTPGDGPLVVQIEDNPVNALLVKRILEWRPSVRLVTFAEGRSGIETIFSERPALVLLDLHLPDMAGSEVLRRLRADERTRSLPIVVLSGDIGTDQRRVALEAGADAFLGKPFDVHELLSLVDHACARAPEVRGG